MADRVNYLLVEFSKNLADRYTIMLEKIKSKCRNFLGITQATEEIEQLKAEIRDLKNCLSESKVLRDIILQLQTGVNLDCNLNYINASIPIEILKNYIHCLHWDDRNKIFISVETHCSDWLSKYLEVGDTVLDIGAAFGVISLPLSKVVGQKGCVYAFEPALKTRAILQRLIEANQLCNIKVISKAISDESGMAEFMEFSSENSLSWAPDTSTLETGIEPTLENYSKYAVEVTTIDEFVQAEKIQPKAIKIDIEGFEQYALQGAKQTLEAFHPSLCIDIHQDIKTQKSTLLTVEPFLKNLGYTCECREHTLFCVF